MSRLHFVRRALPLGVGLLFVAVPTRSSGPHPAALCAGETADCKQELGSMCLKDDGTYDADHVRVDP